MKTLITKLLLVIALSTGIAAAHLSLQQNVQEDDSTFVSNVEASQQEIGIIGTSQGLESGRAATTHNARARNKDTKRQEPGLMILLGISLISAASYLRRVNHQKKVP